MPGTVVIVAVVGSVDDCLLEIVKVVLSAVFEDVVLAGDVSSVVDCPFVGVIIVGLFVL